MLAYLVRDDLTDRIIPRLVVVVVIPSNYTTTNPHISPVRVFVVFDVGVVVVLQLLFHNRLLT